MVVAHNEHWKMAAGYFLIHGLSGFERQNLIIQCLTKLPATNLEILLLTFDEAYCNMCRAEYLECHFNVGNMKPNWFSHLTRRPVAVFLDLCQMMRLVRNP